VGVRTDGPQRGRFGWSGGQGTDFFVDPDGTIGILLTQVELSERIWPMVAEFQALTLHPVTARRVPEPLVVQPEYTDLIGKVHSLPQPLQASRLVTLASTSHRTALIGYAAAPSWSAAP
jgi:hypothetical protein